MNWSGQTYRREFWDDDSQRGQAVDDEICRVIMGVVCADEEQHDGYGKQELLRWGVLVSSVNLLPHVEVVESAGVEVEGHAADVVEHEIGSGHI